jgi:hypothetical protein
MPETPVPALAPIEEPSPAPSSPHVVVSAALLALGVAWALIAAHLFGRAHELSPVVDGPGVTDTHLLSEWHAPLAGTPGDTTVYDFDSGVEGAQVLLLFGTHPNEPASVVAGTVVAENAVCRAGRMLVAVHTNPSGFTHGDPQEGYVQRFEIGRPDGTRRWFNFGSRYTNPVHQWPDPTLHINPAGQILAGVDSRNLNRCYPGRPDGLLTEQMAWAICELVRREHIDLVIDVHEAAPEYPAVNVLIAHERALDLAAAAQIMLEDSIPGFAINLETSPLALRGLSHREIGDWTPAQAVLMESANPSQGRLKGPTSEAQVVEGRDAAYQRAYAIQMDRQRSAGGANPRPLLRGLPYDAEQGTYPMAIRVARHLATASELMADLEGERGAILVEGIPTYEEIVERGIGAFLAPPPGG